MADEKDPLSSTGTDITIAVIALLIVLGILGAYLASVLDLYRAFLDWIYSLGWDRIFRVLMVMFIVFDAILFAFIIFTMRRHSQLEKNLPYEKAEEEIHIVPLEDEVGGEWRSIQELGNSLHPTDWNMAIIRADGLLDIVLQRLGYEGETMADRLKIVDRSKLPSMERVWSAHRLRNTIVHGPIEDHTKETIVHALRSYEISLKELGALKESN